MKKSTMLAFLIILFSSITTLAQSQQIIAGQAEFNSYPSLSGDAGLSQDADHKAGLFVGKQVPAFKITSLDDAQKVITKESLIGKIYLIDFWATWCGPCVREMNFLHAAYQKYKDKNFQILSISIDETPEDIQQFRKDGWPMPWLNSFAGNGVNSGVVSLFGVSGVPTIFLVDETGKIIEMENELRGEKLEKSLNKVFKK